MADTAAKTDNEEVPKMEALEPESLAKKRLQPQQRAVLGNPGGPTEKPVVPGAVRVEGVGGPPRSGYDSSHLEVPSTKSLEPTLTAVIFDAADLENQVRQRMRDEAVEAEVHPAKKEWPRWQTWLLIGVAMLVVVVLVVTLCTVLMRRTTETATFPSTEVSQFDNNTLTSFLQFKMADGALGLTIMKWSPSKEAFQWLLQYDTSLPLDGHIVDRFVLLALYFAHDGYLWTNSSGWTNQSSVCEWYGVGCSDDGFVTELNLSNNGLRHFLTPETSSLYRLQRLDFSGNRLTFDLPIEWSPLAHLEYMNLSYNQLNTRFDSFVPNKPPTNFWSQLQVLDMSDNSISGTLPSSIGRLSQMQVFDVADNLLTGNLPTTAVANWTNLQAADFSGNNLAGDMGTVVCQGSSEATLTVNCSLVTCSCCQCR